MERTCDVAVIGGGAAGFFGAITAAESPAHPGVVLLEATAHLLAKVRISGGGRCNVTHACFDPADLVKAYPRGGRELRGAFHRWQPRDTVEWFAGRGIRLKTEEDGRMFPESDDSATIVQGLMDAARAAGVEVRTQAGVISVERTGAGFRLNLRGGDTLDAGRVLVATGGGRSSAGFEIARAMGHTVEPLVPSLFTFHISDPRLQGLEGLSVPDAVARAAAQTGRGPVLVTHWGLSGPAILKLSAWAARELAALNYRFPLRLSWIGPESPQKARETLVAARTGPHCRKKVSSWNPWGLAARLWERLCAEAGDVTWAATSNRLLDRLSAEAADATFQVDGKSLNKDEFVTCGGVRLSEVDFRTMESRLCPGLYFAGEVLDIDGVTGGYNFQAAWTTGHIAGAAMAAPRAP